LIIFENAWMKFMHESNYSMMKRTHVLFLLSMFGAVNIMISQTKLTSKVGYEVSYLELDGLGIYDVNNNYYSAASGLGWGRLTTLQVGGRFGMAQEHEAGFGIAFGQMSFRDLPTNIDPIKVNRKSIYMIRWSEDSSDLTVGVGSQIYWYNMEFESTQEVPLTFNDEFDLYARWRCLGTEWRALAKWGFGAQGSHEVMCYLGLSVERIRLDEALSDGSPLEVMDMANEWTLGARLGLTYSYTFGRTED
jgi:hypothetical protein